MLIKYALPSYILDDLQQIRQGLSACQPTDYEAAYEALLAVIDTLCTGQDMQTGEPYATTTEPEGQSDG